MFISGGRIKLASLPDAHDAAINQVIALIPDNTGVTASNNIFPHLCSRTDVYLDAWEGDEIESSSGLNNVIWGYPERETDYVIFDVGKDIVMASNLKIILSQYALVTDLDGVMLFSHN
jgi:hypothetical protein